MEREQTGPPAALSIAGSDSGGGAGIQADLKAFARCGVHGMTAVTAITAQNTTRVEAIEPVSPAMIVAQVRAVAEDIRIHAIKVGMLGDSATIAAACDAIDLVHELVGSQVPVVADPVMVAESGAQLLSDPALGALREQILPRATVVTPNMPEARALTGLGAEASQPELARAVLELGPGAVVVTGGHSPELVDLFCQGSETTEIAGDRHPGANAHGSGCTHSSALAARLAHGDGPLEAARRARAVAADAVGHGLDGIGSGPGPVDALRVGSGSHD